MILLLCIFRPALGPTLSPIHCVWSYAFAPSPGLRGVDWDFALHSYGINVSESLG